MSYWRTSGPLVSVFTEHCVLYEHLNYPTTYPSHDPDCRRSEHGTDYIGHVNTTKSGLPCQPWRAQSPHAHSFTKGQYFPDRNVTLARNFCRNPETSGRPGLWCYTTTEGVTWEECDVPRCSGVTRDQNPRCTNIRVTLQWIY